MLEATNRLLAETYNTEHNARFAVTAAEEGSAFVLLVGDRTNIRCARNTPGCVDLNAGM